MKVYLIGSLRNPEIPKIAKRLREATGYEVFDDWHAAGPNADDHWRDYEQARGHNMAQALKGHTAQHVFAFDRKHLDSSDAVVLAWPAGKSAHLELGYAVGKGKHGFVLIDGEPERFDVMLNFADAHTDLNTLVAALKDKLEGKK